MVTKFDHDATLKDVDIIALAEFEDLRALGTGLNPDLLNALCDHLLDLLDTLTRVDYQVDDLNGRIHTATRARVDLHFELPRDAECIRAACRCEAGTARASSMQMAVLADRWETLARCVARVDTATATGGVIQQLNERCAQRYDGLVEARR